MFGLLASSWLPTISDSAPVVLQIGAYGRRVFHDFERELEPQLAAHGALGGIADWGGKLPGKIARIAGLLHVAEFESVEEAAATEIQVATMEAAIGLGRYLIDHAKAAFGEMGTDPTRGEARIILGWLRAHQRESITKREAFNGLRSRFERSDKLDAPLRLLVDLDYLRALPAEEPTGPGRPPSPRFDVNHLSWVDVEPPGEGGRPGPVASSGGRGRR